MEDKNMVSMPIESARTLGLLVDDSATVKVVVPDSIGFPCKDFGAFDARIDEDREIKLNGAYLAKGDVKVLRDWLTAVLEAGLMD